VRALAYHLNTDLYNTQITSSRLIAAGRSEIQEA